MKRWVLAALALALATPRADAQCAFAISGTTNGYSRINFTPLGTPPPGVSGATIGDALNVWAYGCSGDYGFGFPELTEGPFDWGAQHTMNVYIVWHQGTSPSAPPANGRCANAQVFVNQTTGEIDGAHVDVYETQSNGVDCKPTMTNIVAHEIGHVLGLGDVDWNSACDGTIMGRNPSYLSSDQCQLLNANWKTMLEAEQEAQAQCEYTCPYDCTGWPPSCPSSGGNDGDDPGPWTPLILDLNGDGIHTTGAADPVAFDLNGDGVKERLTWTDPATEEAFLWIDLKPNGRVDDGTELFGSGTVLLDGTRAKHGFEALAEFDLPSRGGNGDGRLDKKDDVWNRLRLWVDANHDGMSAPSENGPIAQYGVLEIRLQYFLAKRPDESGNIHKLRSTFTRRVHGAGAPRLLTFMMHDVFFQRLP